MKKLYHVLFSLSLLAPSALQAQAIFKPLFTRLDKIVAIANREVITQSELTKEMDRARQQLEHSHQPVPPAGELRKQILDGLIGRSLQLQLSKAAGMKATDQDVNKAIENMAKANHLTLEQLKQALLQSGLSFDDYKRQIHDQLLLQKLQQEQVTKTVTLLPEDVKKFARENKDKLNPYSAYHVVDVLLPTTENMSTTQVEQIRKQSSQLALQMQKGNDLDLLLKQYPMAEQNDFGWRSLPEYPSLFQPKIANLRVNKVSAPVQAPNGFHILKLVEARGDNPKPTETDIKNFAFQHKAQAAVKEWADKLRRDSYVKILN